VRPATRDYSISLAADQPPIGSYARSALRRGHEQFEIVPIGIQEVDRHASDRVTNVNIES